MNCSKGWEWWLSIVWQFFWAWIYAPYMLWKSRSVRDVHGWRIQTILCSLVGYVSLVPIKNTMLTFTVFPLHLSG